MVEVSRQNEGAASSTSIAVRPVGSSLTLPIPQELDHIREQFAQMLRNPSALPVAREQIPTGPGTGSEESPYTFREMILEPERTIRKGVYYQTPTDGIARILGPDGKLEVPLTPAERLNSYLHLLKLVGIEVPRETLLGRTSVSKIVIRGNISEYSNQPGITASGERTGISTQPGRIPAALQYNLSHYLADALDIPQEQLRRGMVRGRITEVNGNPADIPLYFNDTGGLHLRLNTGQWGEFIQRGPVSFQEDGTPVFELKNFGSNRVIDMFNPRPVRGLTGNVVSGTIELLLPGELSITGPLPPDQGLRKAQEYATERARTLVDSL